MIRRNSARCELCDTEIESKSRHNFVTCACGNLSVDGGIFYLRRVIRTDNSWTETSDCDPGDL